MRRILTRGPPSTLGGCPHQVTAARREVLPRRTAAAHPLLAEGPGPRRRRHRPHGRHQAGQAPQSPGPFRGLPRHSLQGGRCPAARIRQPCPNSARPVFPAPASPPARQPAAAGDTAWIPAGQPVYAGGYAIPGGLVYAGSGLAAEKGGMPEPRSSTLACRSTSGPLTTPAPRWATGRPTPASRRTAGPPTCTGFSTAGAPPAHTSGTSSCTSTAWNVACSSTRSGRRRPGPSTPRWSGKWSACCASTGRTAHSAATPGTCSASCPCPVAPGGTCPHRRRRRQEAWELPFELRLGLGQLAADARPVPAAWALAWVRHAPGSLAADTGDTLPGRI